MRKREKVETIKEMAGIKKEIKLTQDEIKLIKARGYSVKIFLAGSCAISIFHDEDKKTVQALEGIARKLDRKIIRFEAIEEILGH